MADDPRQAFEQVDDVDLTPSGKGAIVLALAASAGAGVGEMLPWLTYDDYRVRALGIDPIVTGFDTAAGIAVAIFAGLAAVLSVIVLIDGGRWTRRYSTAIGVCATLILILSLRAAIDTDAALARHGIGGEIGAGPMVAAAGGALLALASFWSFLRSD